jgi:predicted AAA+ superfamily ATPase
MMTEAQTAIPSGEGLTFEKVWLMYQETAERFKETDKKFQETDRRFKETDKRFKETERFLKDLSRKYGEISDRLGEIVESLVSPDMQNKFNDIGFDVHSTATDIVRTAVIDGKKKTLYEIDVLLEDGDKAIAVEVKSKPCVEDVQDHIERLEKIRAYADGHGDKRQFYGAIAGAIFPESVRTYALKKGLYVIDQTGDTMRIVEPEHKAKAW